MEHYIGTKKKTTKFSGNLMELQKKHSDYGNTLGNMNIIFLFTFVDISLEFANMCLCFRILKSGSYQGAMERVFQVSNGRIHWFRAHKVIKVIFG